MSVSPLNVEWEYDGGTKGLKVAVEPQHAIRLVETLIIQEGIDSIKLTRCRPRHPKE